MLARYTSSPFRVGCVSLLLASLLAGCGGTGKETGKSSGADPQGGTRRKQMEDFMKNQPPGGTKNP